MLAGKAAGGVYSVAVHVVEAVVPVVKVARSAVAPAWQPVAPGVAF